MRFPSLDVLAARARHVIARFPWTITAGVLAAAFAIAASYADYSDELLRAAMVAALGLPASVALTLLAERRRWPAVLRHGVHLAAAAALAGFWFVWPGPDEKHDVLRYLQLSAVLHLSAAFLPWLATPETRGFWQYNRRLFLGFLRAGVFSAVLFVGIIVALAALDALFGVDIDDDVIARIWFAVAFVVNTFIFLAAAPGDLAQLEHDTEYPRALKVFAQYILTPLAFSYLLILLAYLVKLVAGAEWPSGWIGWLVTSVAVTGILGFLLVHPLRDEAGEGWIRTYTRWLFIGLAPASIMLLVAFWKRIVPYGMTEPRVLGMVLGGWLLAISIGYAIRPGAGIRPIPVSLAALLLLMLYGPLSPPAISVASQRDRLAELLPLAADSADAAREASAALRFLVEHRADDEIAVAIGREVPPTVWDSSGARGAVDSVSSQIMALAGAPYVPWYDASRLAEGYVELHSTPGQPRSVTGYDWIAMVGSGESAVGLAGGDTLRSSVDPHTGVLSVSVGADTFRFELLPLLAGARERRRSTVPADSLLIDASGDPRARLALLSIGARVLDDTAAVRHFNGWLMVRETGR